MHVSREMIPDEAQRVERVLASARAFMAVASLIAIFVDPTEPSRFDVVAYSLMVLYVFFSLSVFVLVRLRPSAVRFRLGFHAVDILWPALIGVFTSGPGSPFFLFYTFVLLAAAYRWGLKETLVTAGVTIVLFISEGFVGAASSNFSFLLGEGGFDVNRYLMRSFDLLIFGYLLGYLGEEEKRLRQEAWFIARLIGRIQSATGLAQAVGAVLTEITHHFGADRCVLAVSNERTEENALWYTNPKAGDGEPGVSMRNLTSHEKGAYTFKLSWAAWHGLLVGMALDVRSLDRQGKWSRERWTPPEEWMEYLPLEGALCTAVDYGKEWSGNLILLGGRQLANDNALHRLQALIIQTSPAVYNVYLTQRLRSRAGAAERARVARELHDGVIQSLIGIEMQVDVLRRLPPPEGRMAGELERIQNQLRQEVLNVRELMEQMRSFDIGPRQLSDFLAFVVDKFWRDTGIAASFSCSVDEIALHPRACHEVARITQEALANVRRHSGARHVVVSFAQEDGKFKLVIDDDGQGFSFPGRLTQAELDAHHKGPVVIKERVRAIGGDLVVDSRPGEGARLEITIPRNVHA
jgi:signal transduction histidine kinase